MGKLGTSLLALLLLTACFGSESGGPVVGGQSGTDQPDDGGMPMSMGSAGSSAGSSGGGAGSSSMTMSGGGMGGEAGTSGGEAGTSGGEAGTSGGEAGTSGGGGPDPDAACADLSFPYEDKESADKAFKACSDDCSSCCKETGSSGGSCQSNQDADPYWCTCVAIPPPPCGEKGCGEGMECCDGGVPCSPVCVPIGQGCGCEYDCNSPDTPILTPTGMRPVAELVEGDLVMTVHGGEIVAMPVVATRLHAVTDHGVVQLLLDNGTTLEISGNHPTADGRQLQDLSVGDTLGEAVIVTAGTIPYEHPFTHDIQVASDTGTYFAGGAHIASTIGTASTITTP